MRSCTKALLVALALGLAAGPAATLAQLPLEGQPSDVRRTPVLIRADEMRHEQELGLVIASGNVEITQADRTLIADTVTYDQKNDLVTASGNVALLEPTGDVVFADFVEITGDLKDGVIDNLRMRMLNNARLAAAGARRTGGTVTEMRKAVYSACEPCKDDPQAAPLWQVKASRAVHDIDTHDVTYNDAWVEFWGVPVLYTPYLSHPDPTVKRRTGFLVPTWGHEGNLGLFVRTPYYFDIEPHIDATLTPMWTTDEGVMVAGEYRQRFAHGMLKTNASITRGTNDRDQDATRGHIDAVSRFDFDETWRGGLEYAYASDDTYLRRYGFPSPSTLVSRAHAEGFRSRTYAAGNAYHFQGLRIDDWAGNTPIIAPLLDYNFVGEPWLYDSRFSIDSNLAVISRTEATDMRRVSTQVGWELPYTSDWGERYTVFASTLAQAYWVDDLVLKDRGSSSPISGTTGRLFPQAGVDWRLPLVRGGRTGTDLIEPVAGFVVAPNVGQSKKIPNEDSRDLELDDTNLFKPNRFPGIDRLEGGARFNYGLRTATYFQKGYISAFAGQSYRPRTDSNFSQGSGLNNHFSDVVGRIDMIPVDYVRLLYRFRLDKENLAPKRTEIGAQVGPRALNARVDYVALDRLAGTTDFITDREEITLSVNSQLDENWSVGAHTRRDIDAGTPVYHALRAVYEDECFVFAVDYTRSFTSDRDVRPSDRLLFRLELKTIGAFETGT